LDCGVDGPCGGIRSCKQVGMQYVVALHIGLSSFRAPTMRFLVRFETRNVRSIAAVHKPEGSHSRE
jgi:hypothetical protein